MVEICTVGHSNLSLEDFLALIRAHGVGALADVRRFPGSRRQPHFHASALAESLPSIGVEYHSFRELGGFRKARADSVNVAWRNLSFRGYADYMETEEFRGAAERLLALGEEKKTAYMCAEAHWSRCHRSLLSDYLMARGAQVIHILSVKRTQVHPYTSAARIVDGALSYKSKTQGTLFD